MNIASEKTVEDRMQRLEEIENIRRLKYYYTWYLDNKMWDEYSNLMADDMVYIGTGNELAKKDFIPRVATHLAPLVTSHQLHQSLIDIVSDTEAKAVWCLRDELNNPTKGGKFKGRAYYKENYVKVDGEWKIQRMELIYLCTEGASQSLGNDPSQLGLVM